MSDRQVACTRGIISTQRAENARQTRIAVEQRSAMIAEADRLVERFIAVQAPIRRIVLFGSLVHPFHGRASRDIDLWVEGATSIAELERIADDSPYAVDIVDGAMDGSAIANQVRKYGKVLYEAKP